MVLISIKNAYTINSPVCLTILKWLQLSHTRLYRTHNTFVTDKK